MQVTRWGIDRPTSDVMSDILNFVCPECGGSMGGVGREFKCLGECQTDWRHIWKQVLLAGLNRPTTRMTRPI
jgi:tRNA(Ile2) C34 agmatinyltransferase TiaS